MIYRALRDLSIGKTIVQTGELFKSERLRPDALEILEGMGKVAPASLPPMAALPRFKSKAAALAKIEVKTAGDFLEMDDSVLAKALKSTEAEIRQIKAEMYAQFATPKIKN